MLKPYFVELKVTAVVMAESELDAMDVAEFEAREIVCDSELTADCAVPVKSLDHLRRLDPTWDGMCLPYNGDGVTKLYEMLPKEDPFVDTKTADG